MNRIHRLRPLVLLIAGFAVLSIAEPLQAQKAKQGKFQGSIYVPLPTPLPSPLYPGTFEIRAWTDKVSPLGYVSGYFTVDTPSGSLHRTGRIFLQNRNGDSVSLTYEVDWPSVPGDPNFYGTFTVVSGTGKFAGATGGGPFRHQQYPLPPYPYIPAWFDGLISY